MAVGVAASVAVSVSVGIAAITHSTLQIDSVRSNEYNVAKS